MRLICPFTSIEPDTREALDASGREWEAHDVSGSDTAYWELLRGLWSDGETFCIVEHDIVPTTPALDDLERCPFGWCANSYAYLGGLYTGLGCMRFRAGLMERYPDLMDVVGRQKVDGHILQHWCVMDFAIRSQLIGRNVKLHPHVQIGHVRASEGIPQPSHGCCGAAVN